MAKRAQFSNTIVIFQFVSGDDESCEEVFIDESLKFEYLSYRIRFHMARVVWGCVHTLRDEPAASPVSVSGRIHKVDCHRRSKVLIEDFSGFSEQVEDSLLLSVVDRQDKLADDSAILGCKLCRRHARMIQSLEVLRVQNCKLDKSAPHQLHLLDDIDMIQLRIFSRRNQMNQVN